MKFRTQFDPHDRVNCNPGDRIHILHAARYNDDGALELYESGKENLYDYIQSFAQSVDIHYLLEKFVNGDNDALARAQGFYLDASDLPKTYAEILNSVLAGEQAFASLPAEIKRKFNNSFSEWMASFESPDFLEKMGINPTPDKADPSVSPDFVSDSGAVLAQSISSSEGGNPA